MQEIDVLSFFVMGFSNFAMWSLILGKSGVVLPSSNSVLCNMSSCFGFS